MSEISSAIRTAFRRASPWYLALAGVVLYLPSLLIGFLTDDYILLADLSRGALPWMTELFSDAGLFRPIVALTLKLDLTIYGEWSAGFHFTNLLLHAGSVLFLTLSAHQVLRTSFADLEPDRPGVIWFWVLVFALHPANSVDVIWISGRSDLLAAFFLTAAWWSFLSHPSPASTGRSLVTSLLLGLACLSKEVAVTGVLPLFMIVVLRPRKDGASRWSVWKEAFRETKSLWAIVVGYSLFRLLAFPSAPPMLLASDTLLRDVGLLIAKTVVLAIAPLDLLTLQSVLLRSPLTVVAVGAGVLGIGAWIWYSMRAERREWFVRGASMLFVLLGMSGLHLLSGTVTQRLMYVPLAGMVLTAIATRRRFVPAGADTGERTLVRSVSLAALMIFALGAARNLNHWFSASKMERTASIDLARIIDKPDAKAIVLMYPHRILQTGVFWGLGQRVHYEQTGKFGKREGIWPVVGIIGRSADSLGWSVRFAREDKPGGFRIWTTSEDEYLVVDRSQVPPTSIEVIERPGTVAATAAADVRIDSLNQAWRPRACTILLHDTVSSENVRLVIWQNGTFRDIGTVGQQISTRP